MEQLEEVLKLLLETAKEMEKKTEETTVERNVPVGISNRHVHLSQQDLDTLFGSGYELTKMKDLSQTGQYACKETVTVCGPKRSH